MDRSPQSGPRSGAQPGPRLGVEAPPAEPAITDEEVVAQSTAGAATTTAAGLLGRAAGLLTTLLVTHYLSRAEYGRANLAMILVLLVGVATLLSPQQALMTRSAEFPAAARLVHGWSVWSGGIIALALAAVGRPLLTWLHEPLAVPILDVYCIALVLERAGTIPSLALRYRLRFGEVVRVDLGGDLCYVAVTIGTALAGVGPICLALGTVARHLGRLALLVAARTEVGWPELPRLRVPEQRRLAAQIARFSAPIHFGGISEYLTLYLDNLVVGQLYSASAQGLYAVGYTLVMTPIDTIALYGTTAMVRALGVQSSATRKRAYLQSVRYVSLLLLPLGAGAALVAGTLETALFPAHWHGVAAIMLGIGLGGTTQGLSRLSFAHLSALHRPRLAGVVNAARLGLFVLSLYVAAQLDGARQHVELVAWAVSVAFLGSALVGIWMSLRVEAIPARQVLRALAPPILGTVVMAGGLLGIQRGLAAAGMPATVLRLCFEIAAGALLYVGYLRLAHAELWHEAITWLRRNRQS